MILTKEQQAIIDGEKGETLAKVMKTLVMYGDAFGADKMNYELLGNGDTHLHWHLYPRRKGDLDKDGIDYGTKGIGPVWWVPWNIMNHEKYKVGGEELEKMKNELRAALDEVLGRHGKD